jgi:putative membrane protein
MASLAKQNSSSPQVKSFADQIIKDHKAEEDKVMRFADNHNIDMAAVSQQLRAMRGQVAQRTLDDREARSVGSATGEWAFMGEPGGSGPMDHIAKQESEVQKLSTLKGPAFDREFTKAMVSDHQAIIKRLTNARTQVNDPDAVALVDKLLPTAKRHLSMAQNLQATIAKAP